jgi:hypothetical protein
MRAASVLLLGALVTSACGVEIGTDGVPTWVSVDHRPDAIDDEECYRVSGFRALD